MEADSASPVERARAYNLFPDVDRDNNSLEGSCATLVEAAFDEFLDDRPFLLTDEDTLEGVNKSIVVPSALFDIWPAAQVASLLDEKGRPAKVRLQDLDEALRKYLAWASILDEAVSLNLDPSQTKQAENQRQAAVGAVAARLPETYQWLLVPEQKTAQAQVEWHSIRLSGTEALAARATKKLKSDELLIGSLAASRLRMELDRIPLWRGNHVPVRQIVEDFGRYLYLPRVRDSAILVEAIREGFELLTWQKDSFAYADSYDEKEDRYRGLRCGQVVNISASDPVGLLVRPDVARAQMETEEGAATASGFSEANPAGDGGITSVSPPSAGPGMGRGKAIAPKRFYGSVTLDSTRVGRDAGRIADEVISHLAGLVGSTVKVTLEIVAQAPTGVPENVVRTVTENSRTLKFDSHGFEDE